MERLETGTLDGRTRPALAIRRVAESLAVDLGASEVSDLPVQQRLLVQRVAAKAVVLALMEGHALGRGVIGQDGTLLPPLHEHYLAFANSLRLDLQALGLDRRQKDVADVAAALARLGKDKPHGRGCA